MSLKNTLSAVLSKLHLQRERLICRIIAAWCSFAAVIAISQKWTSDLSFAQSTPIYSFILWMTAFFVFYSLMAAILSGVHTDSWFLFISALLCVIKWLSEFGAPAASFGLTYEKDVKAFMFLFAIIVAFSLVTVYFIGKNSNLFSKIRIHSRTCIIISIVFALAGGIVISVITCLRYKTFSAGNFDFGLFCQSFHYMKTTGLPMVTCERDVLLSHFVVHFSPIFYLLLPFYAVFSSPVTLQIGQAIICFSGVIPILFLCRHFKSGCKTTIFVCLIYSLYPALSCGCLYDFHENCFLCPLLLWTFLFFEKEKWIPMYFFAFSVLAVKEDAAVYIVIFAIFAIISKKKYLHGALLCCLGIAYFAVVTTVLNNSASYWAEYYSSLGETANPSIAGVMVNRFDNLIYVYDKEAGLAGAIKTLLTNPGFVLTQLFNTKSEGIGKLVYFIQMILCLGLTPFAAKKASRWLLIIPMLVNLLTMYQYQYNIGFQYSFGITAFLFYAMILNVSEMRIDLKRNMLAVGVVTCLCLYIVAVVPYLGSYSEKWSKGKETYNHISEVLETLPDDASLNVSSPLVAHLSDHDVVYDIAYHGDAADVDYVVYYYPYLNKESKNKYLNAGYTVWKNIEGEIIDPEKW